MFQNDKLYKMGDPELERIAKPSTLNHWRVERKGPPFVRLGARIAYEGRALNEWVRSRTVQTNG